MTEAKTLLPGGVNSPVRAFRSVGGNPIVFDRVKGAYAYDVDGNKYIDYVGSWGPAIVGHANDEVNEAIKAQVDKGTSFGAPCELENVLAKMVIERVPSVEMVRFVSSGTEACLSVLRLMRAFTGREKIVKFVGCYHGHADSFLVKAGSGVATLGLPDSPGVFCGGRGEGWKRGRCCLHCAAFFALFPLFFPTWLLFYVHEDIPVSPTCVHIYTHPCTLMYTHTSIQIMYIHTQTNKHIHPTGVPKSSTAATLTCTYNDIEGIKKIFEDNKGEIAGVILEPVVGNSGFIPPTMEFLKVGRFLQKKK